MMKIGKTYIDDEFRWALSPCLGYDDGQYMAVLQNGTKVSFRATDGMVEDAMKAAGYDGDGLPDPRSCFTDEEWYEVQEAIEAGYSWIAKDRRGITSAYETKPVREGAYWNDPIGKQPRRLFCDYNCLEEGEATCLSDLFGPASITVEDEENA